MTKTTWKYLGAGAVALLLVIQLVPAGAASNPPVESEVVVPAEVDRVLRQSCYDCHSNETTWPWYAYVAPPKWFVRDHVHEGRDGMNFSAWNRLSAEDRPHKWEEVAEEVEEGHMPLRSYLWLHPDARLSDADRQTLIDWAMSQAEPGED